MANPYTKGAESITQAEHISPAKTGDNIEAKRVANYVWNPDGINPTTGLPTGAWERQSSSTSANTEPYYARDTFGRTKVSTDANQVEIPFDDTNYTNFIDITSSGGATGASQANGQVTLTSGTGTNASYVVLSKDANKYRLGQEIGWGGTFRFDATGLANAVIWIGATDDTSLTNGVLFGWWGTDWGVRYRRGGSTIWTKTPADWLDLCDGSVDSEYTSGGSPVAMDKTKDQIFRIRAGLFGHKGFIVELLCPDGFWVKVIDHTNVNSETVAVFTNNDLKVGTGLTKTGAGSTSITITSACLAGWTASDKARINDTLSDRTLASRVVAALVGRTNAGNWVGVSVNSQGRLFVTNDAVGATGSAVPASASYTGVISGGNLTGLIQPTTPTDTQPISAASLPLPSGAATAANQQTDALTDTELRATPVEIADPNKQSALPYAEILTASATITPTGGKKIKLLKAQVLQSPANETYNVVTLNFASLGDVVTGWAYSDSNEWIGAVDEVLNITLSNANPVSVNIRYKEI